MKKIEIDARGLSCPEPVVVTMNGIKKDTGEVIVKVDTNVSKENVSRFLEGKKFKVEVKEIGNEFEIIGKK